MSELLAVDDPAACPATREGTTARGPIVVRCRKPAGHVEAGDGRHEGRTGADPGMPVYWQD
jgi:hypothetical protein